eukprot:SAG11_NODE_26850_length_340_cov_0.634855_1_plen_55_part_10
MATHTSDAAEAVRCAKEPVFPDRVGFVRTEIRHAVDIHDQLPLWTTGVVIHKHNV